MSPDPRARLHEVVLVEGDVVNSVAAGIAHHHFTGHVGGGSDEDYQCEECPFEIYQGIVESGGSIAVLADPIADRSPINEEETNDER